MSRKDNSFAFLGAGHIASALIENMLNQGYDGKKIIATRRNQRKLIEYAARHNIRTAVSNSEAVQKADVVLLCVRPNQLRPLLDEVLSLLDSRRHLVISVIAGLRLDTLTSLISCPVVRLMPNMAGRVGAGVTAFLPSANTTGESLILARDIAKSLGVVLPAVDDQQMDSYTALCGSGIAYVYHFLSLLTDSGASLGLPAEQASLAAFHTMRGAIRLMEQEGKDPATYLAEIQVPQGTTAAAMDLLAVDSFKQTLLSACRAAQTRSAAIGGELAVSLNSTSSSAK